MTISYNWLSAFIPVKIDPHDLSNILTSVGLEVEHVEEREDIPGGLKGLIVGEVIDCVRHPEADKLKLAKVSIGEQELQIVCGATNIATGQKVVVAPVGTTIYPVSGVPVTMKKAKIRGIESFGMICAEDEIGMGVNHDGILVLPEYLKTGSFLSEHVRPKTNWVFEIGLTPNRMNAMSHLGVARDICAWYAHHNKANINIISPFPENYHTDTTDQPIEVIIDNKEIAPRYAGVTISGVKVAPSPAWLTERLTSIGLKSINNIVDITNFILHETGQPLHAFDLEAIKGRQIMVKQLPEGTSFVTLDEKERKLGREDIMICDGKGAPLCIGGVFGGIGSGVSQETTSIFLESANFNPVLIRKSLLRHGLRTDAAVRFEKGVDISKTTDVLKHAAMLIKSVAGGSISSEIVDVYPEPKAKNKVTLTWDYLKKISGKIYDHTEVSGILKSLGFEIDELNDQFISVLVPFSNPDITIPVDVIEEIMRIDGLDQVGIPPYISMAPSLERSAFEMSLKEKISGYLTSNGFAEILTNSITNSAYYKPDELVSAVKIINSLSNELDVMKPEMLHTALECIAHNLNRKSNALMFFEFGKTYHQAEGKYTEQENLMFYVSSDVLGSSWKGKGQSPDIFYLKGLLEKVALISGVTGLSYSSAPVNNMTDSVEVFIKKQKIGELGNLSGSLLNRMSVRQPVLCIHISWPEFLKIAQSKKPVFEEISKFPQVNRELSIVVDVQVPFDKIQQTTRKANLQRLSATRLLNVFESEKLGAGKKSFALGYTFFDRERTMTDPEIDQMMNKLMGLYENDLGAQIRKG